MILIHVGARFLVQGIEPCFVVHRREHIGRGKLKSASKPPIKAGSLGLNSPKRKIAKVGIERGLGQAGQVAPANPIKAGLFAINATTGALTVSNSAALAATATTAYTLSVSVADSYTTSAVESLTVNFVQPFAAWAAAAGLGGPQAAAT